MLEGDYYGFYFVNILCEYDLPHITLDLHSLMSKYKKRSIFSSDHFRSISKFAKIFITKIFEGDYFGSIL